MKINIKSRDVKFFLLGIAVAFLISVIYDWDGHVQSFNEGFSAGKEFFGGSH